MGNGRFDDPMSGSSAGRSSSNQLNPRFVYRPFLVPIKVFKCRYCERKFLNSRALGGHQNAHKKERTLWMMGFSNHKSMVMDTHALPCNPVRARSSSGQPKESFKRFQEALRLQTSLVADDQGLSWPGSFPVNSTGSHGPDAEARNGSKRAEKEIHLNLDLHL